MTHLPPSTRSQTPTTKADAFAQGLSFAPLLAHLQRQYELYRRLLALGGRMTEMVQTQRGEELPALMDEREQAIEELRKIDAQLQAYRLHWIEWFPKLEAGEREQITQLTATLEQLRSQVREEDQTQVKWVRSERDRLGRELGVLGQANRAAQSYRGQLGSAMLPSTDRQG